MKKIILSVLMIVMVLTARPQLQQGNLLVGADIADFNLSLNEGGNFSIMLEPKIAWFVRDNLAVGGYAKFGLFTSEGAGESIDYGVGALGRLYISQPDLVVVRHSRFFIEGTAGIEGTNPASGENTNGLGLGFGPGWAYFITSNVGLEALVKYNGIVGFGDRATSSNINLGIGLQIYLPRSRVESRIESLDN